MNVSKTTFDGNTLFFAKIDNRRIWIHKDLLKNGELELPLRNCEVIELDIYSEDSDLVVYRGDKTLYYLLGEYDITPDDDCSRLYYTDNGCIIVSPLDKVKLSNGKRKIIIYDDGHREEIPDEILLSYLLW